ncbi:MAG TPA: metallophosphoesterase [Tepidisphaeraceae bacterium]|jgi:hypothetical protein|nr:metallophosphoesterase [Tepidisphaeraceae bacterium]
MSLPSTSTPTATRRRLGPKGKWLQVGSPEGFEWNVVTLPIRDLPDELVGTRIIHLSDLHTTHRWHEAYDVLLDAIRDAQADLVLVTGDFVDDKFDHTAALPVIMKFVAGLSAKVGIFGILGNHDGMRFEPRLADSNVTLLNGQRRVVERHGRSIELIGTAGCLREHVTPQWLDEMGQNPREAGVPRIILSHYPDLIHPMKPLSADVMLSGHTHGGQICLPGGVPIIRHDSLPRRYVKGPHLIDGTWLVPNRGLGFTTLHIRLFCPSEVIEIELTKA